MERSRMGSNKTGSSAGIHVQARGQDCSGGEIQSIHHATVFQYLDFLIVFLGFQRRKGVKFFKIPKILLKKNVSSPVVLLGFQGMEGVKFLKIPQILL